MGGLAVFYPSDIRNILLAMEASVLMSMLADPNDLFAQGFERGHKAALMTFALAFGLVAEQEPQQITRDVIRDWPDRQLVPLMVLIERSD